MQMVYSEPVKSEDWDHRADGAKKPSRTLLHCFGERQTADGQRTDQNFEWTRYQSRHCLVKEHESKVKDSPSRTSMNPEPLLDVLVALQLKTTKGCRAIQITPLHTEQTVR